MQLVRESLVDASFRRVVLAKPRSSASASRVTVREVMVAVHTLENEADLVYRNGIEALFAGQLDARELVRQKDMLSCLEDGVDQCEDAMDVIRSVLVKNG